MSLKKCEIPLKSINVLIGCNGAGKSNFLSALAMLQDVLQQNLQIFAGRSGINSLFYNGIKETDYTFHLNLFLVKIHMDMS